jgi:DNA-binding NarL/FixJ family response regulator
MLAIYTSQRSAEWAKACTFAGANAVISKSADRHEIVAGLRQMLETGEYTDVRLRGSLVDRGEIDLDR